MQILYVHKPSHSENSLGTKSKKVSFPIFIQHLSLFVQLPPLANAVMVWVNEIMMILFLINEMIIRVYEYLTIRPMQCDGDSGQRNDWSFWELIQSFHEFWKEAGQIWHLIPNQTKHIQYLTSLWITSKSISMIH